MIKRIEKYPLLSLLVVVALLMLPSLNHFQVSIMEARNFITAREMLSEGNWILTTMNGEPRYEKPPLPTWIVAIFGFLFGIKNEFALRLPGVLMVWLIGVYTFCLSEKILKNNGQSFINALIAVSSFYVLGIVIEAPWDIYTHAFMLIGIYHLYCAFNNFGKQNIILAILFIAFSVLSKGPVSLYALLLPFLIAYALVFGVKNNFIVKTMLAVIPGVILGSLWLLYVRIADTETFITIADTEINNWTSYEVKPFYYYWSFFIQSGIWTIPAFISLLYPYLKNRVTNLKAYRLSFLWTISSVLLLSLIPEKKTRYLMPTLLPLAINTGFYIQYILKNSKNIKLKKELIPIYFSFGFLGTIAILFPLGIYMFLPEQFVNYFNMVMLFSVLSLTCGCAIIYFMLKKKMRPVFYLTLALSIIFIHATVYISPGFTIQNPNYQSVSHLKEEAENKNIEVYYIDEVSPELIWNYGGIIPKINMLDINSAFSGTNKIGVLVADKNLMKENKLPADYTISHTHTYDLNVATGSSKTYRKRLVNHYFLLEKK